MVTWYMVHVHVHVASALLHAALHDALHLLWPCLLWPYLLWLYLLWPYLLWVQASATMATALKGVNASASGLVVAAALILGQSYATSLPEQVPSLTTAAQTMATLTPILTLRRPYCGSPDYGYTFYFNYGYAISLPGQVIAMLCFSGITFFGVHQALTILLGALLAVPMFWASETFLLA